ncbi:MAG: hypothetical protein R3F17_15665 [Planctomycetota bacterium]
MADLLGDIEQTHVVDWAPEMTGEQAAAPVPGQRTLTFRFRHHLQDEVLVERFGEPFQRPSGAELMPMVRDDDTLPALVPAELATWWQGGAEAWRDSLVWNLPETRVKSLRLIHPTARRARSCARSRGPGATPTPTRSRRTCCPGSIT